MQRGYGARGGDAEAGAFLLGPETILLLRSWLQLKSRPNLSGSASPLIDDSILIRALSSILLGTRYATVLFNYQRCINTA